METSTPSMNFFGTYLLDQGIITAKELDEALKFQAEVNKRIGEMAVEKGFMRKEQVEEIFHAQKGVDKPFGALALELGILSKDQLDDLLFEQTIQSTHLGEALLMRGNITPEQFSAHLRLFQDQESLRSEEMGGFLEELKEHFICELLFTAFKNAFARFANRDIKIEKIGAQQERMSCDIRFDISVNVQEKGIIESSFFLSELLASELVEGLAANGDKKGLDDSLVRWNEFFLIVERYFFLSLEEIGYCVTEHKTQGGLLSEPSCPVHGVVMNLSSFSAPMILQIVVHDK